MRTRQVSIEGAAEVEADLRGAAKTAGVRASRELIRGGRQGLAAAKRSVPRASSATRRSLVLTVAGGDSYPLLGDLDVEVGAVPLPGRGLSAAGWLARGTSRRGPQWNFYGEVENATSSLVYELRKLAGDI